MGGYEVFGVSIGVLVVIVAHGAAPFRITKGRSLQDVPKK